MTERFAITWHDSGREPRQKPDPRYPTGIDLDYTKPDEKSCRVELTYPAQRCGYYSIKCLVCGMTAVVTTAGRSDDPRSVTLPCKPLVH